MKDFDKKDKKTSILSILLLGIGVGLLVYAPVLYRYLHLGLVYSGEGDGFKQMMPFQMQLYEQLSKGKSLYDLSFGLGGDVFQDLTYYYSTSPIMYLNFGLIWLGERLFHLNPHHIGFWPLNQIFVSFLKCVMTYAITHYTMRYFGCRKHTTFIGALLFSASTVLLYFNFTWSFFGDILMYLPLSILGLERLFREKKVGIFILGITLTLFTNFYFSYYEAIALGVYFLYRVIHPYRHDVLNRLQKFVYTVIAVGISVLFSALGFFTGVLAFLNNDRKQNDFTVYPIIDFSQKYHLFTNGFYITVTFIVIIALCSFKLYQYYYYRLFAILTWVLLLASLTQYSDFMFNGFSYPQRRWIYLLAFTSSVLIALWVKHLNEIKIKSYLMACIPVIILVILTACFSRGPMFWLISASLIMIVCGLYVYKRNLLRHQMWIAIITTLFIVQQFMMLIDYDTQNLKPYTASVDRISATKYHSETLQQSIDLITNKQESGLSRLDYMSEYSPNSPMVYGFNGISIYSSIFDGDILKYYDDLMQINVPTDSNSTYRMLGNRANLYALWNVEDRIKTQPDDNIPYGFKKQQTIHDRNKTWEHSHNNNDIPDVRFTSRVYNKSQLKSPLDYEQAMLKGVILDDTKSNTSFKSNPNLLNQAQIKPRDAKWLDHHHLKVTQNDGGLKLTLPKSLARQYQDLYVEMDLERLSPSGKHDVKLNEYTQHRKHLTYPYRRFVSPTTMRVKASENIDLKLPKGKYRASIKGIYGEDYNTLKQVSKRPNKAQVSVKDKAIDVKLAQHQDGYVVLPMPYRDGLQAKVDGENREVKKGNGIMSVVKVNQEDTHLKITYLPKRLLLFTGISLFGALSALLFTWYMRKKKHNA
ncbi:YfhO family protein [Staphylococcus massiliensis]|uniref:Integral membrane protein n=1 Tax=Staphylococcus massiliensis S46 TaxID=1229783 RepID=K9ASV1_9STAP|nr:YfhO family protein [Staphylococcus massiliensis]EKU50458.1 hypothetical protein C273_00505 [Staphylococcus massiliensis S46]MCG3398772.1 YfhO family protein [Staphylococcus massiliensis]